MDKILSIIIPTYNMEKYLRHCLDSLIVPNMGKVEVLVINDGSKDSSSAIGHEYQDKYPQTFRVIDKVNGNYGSCVNRGLKEAKGKYIKILDADDSFNSKNFNMYIETLEKVDVDLVLSNAIIVNEKGEKTGTMDVKTQRNIIFDFQKHPVFVQMHCVAYKTENLCTIGYSQTEGISYTDQEWIFWPMSTVKTAYYTPVYLYKYLMGREGQTMDPQLLAKAFSQELKVLERMIYLWEKYGNEWGHTKNYMFTKLKNWYDGMFKKSIRYGHKEQKSLFTNFDCSLKDKYPKFFSFSNKFCVGCKLLFPYVWYWRHLHIIAPFGFVFKIEEWYHKL